MWNKETQIIQTGMESVPTTPNPIYIYIILSTPYILSTPQKELL